MNVGQGWIMSKPSHHNPNFHSSTSTRRTLKQHVSWTDKFLHCRRMLWTLFALDYTSAGAAWIYHQTTPLITWYWSLKLHYNPRYKNLVVEQNSSCSARSCSDVSMAGVSSRLWRTWSTAQGRFEAQVFYVWQTMYGYNGYNGYGWYVFTKKSSCMHTGFLSKTRCFPRHVISHVRNQ